MDWLEAVKKANPDREEIKNEIVGQAHCENVALGLFAKADKMDRACQFSLNLTKVLIFKILEFSLPYNRAVYKHQIVNVY